MNGEIILNDFLDTAKKYYKPVPVGEIIETWEPKNIHVANGILNVQTISEPIRNHLIDTTQYGYNVYTHRNNTVTVPTYFKINIKVIQRILSRVLAMRRIYKYFSRDNVVNILYFPTDFKKTFPTQQDPLSAHHINNGVTMVGQVTVIFRKEDMPKVLLHELIHYFDLDKTFVKYNIRPDFYFMYQKSKGDLLINEVMTETLAFIWHIVFTSIDRNCEPADLYKQEVDFGITQSAKLFKYYGFDSVDVFDRSCCQSTKPILITNCQRCPVLEVLTPAVVEYYFLRSAMLFNLERVITVLRHPSRTMEMLIGAVNSDRFRLRVNSEITFMDCKRDVYGSSLCMSVIEDTSDQQWNKLPYIVLALAVVLLVYIVVY